MHRTGYAVPISLVTPITVSLLMTFCILRERDVCLFYDILPSHLFVNFSSTFTASEYFHKWLSWIWLLYPLSQAWITIHVWYFECERLATAERIFFIPSYDALIIEQSMSLNRRRDIQFGMYKEFPLKKVNNVAIC